MIKKTSFIFALIPSIYLITGCDGGDEYASGSRLGLVGARTTDPTSIRVKIGVSKMQIPANCLAAPLEAVRSRIDGDLRSDTALMMFLIPKMDCRSKQNSKQFSITGTDRPAITVFMSSGRGVSAGDALSAIADIWTGRNSSPNLKRRLSVEREDGELIKVRRSFSSRKDDYELITVPIDRKWIKVCDGPESVPIPGCTMRFAWESSIVKVGYGSGWEDRSLELMQRVEAKLNSLKESGTYE